MRQSKKTAILEAATRVVEREGIAAVTYDSVAAETGLTKAGLLYHFPSREALLEGLHEYLASRWQAQMEEAAGETAENLTPRQRVAAYAKVCATTSTRADLLLMIEAASNPTLRAYGQSVQERWAPGPTGTDISEADMGAFVLRLAADGLWLYDAWGGDRLHPELRRKVADYLADALAQQPRTGR
ncbi:TetR/AcrR family transcriptional regulator [Nocardiopsis dassonvillei]|uniref:TetR/AcrR family transcriptional regulator n=1 Tax=Nocardiopsis dassonvillei TaxID=2014 RepID=UPI00366E6591